MSNILTISLLNLLSEAEKTALGKYLQSPFFTKKEFLYPLYLELRKAEKVTNELSTPNTVAVRNAATAKQKIKKPRPENLEATFARVFPKGPYNRHKWNKALSDLNGHIEHFVTVRHFLSDQDLYQQARIDALFVKENEPAFQQAVDVVLKSPPKKVAPEKTDAWWLRFKSRKRQITYPLTNRMKFTATVLEDMEADLDIYYYISKLQLACNRISGAQFLKHASPRENHLRLLEQVKPAVSTGKSPLLCQYYNLLSLLLGTDMDFATFFDALKAQGKYLDRSELETIVRFAFSYCIGRSRQGEERALDWHIDLYTWSHAQGAWTEAVAEDLFLNMGVLFAKTHKMAEFDSLLKSGTHILPEDRREEAIQLLMACRYFYQDNFDAAQDVLVRINTRHPRYALLRHSLVVRNAYMLWQSQQIDLEQLVLALSRFNDFLNRQGLFASALSQSYKELIWFVRRLIQVRQVQNTTKTVLRKEIKKRQPAAHDWIEMVIGSLPIKD
jgi:hypothetical protein